MKFILVPTPPPYPPESFDRILLDAPCSALGQRPQPMCSISLTELMSYPAYQRSLFEQVCCDYNDLHEYVLKII